MSQIDFVVDQLRRAFDGEAWHGPALMEILDGIDTKTASARPIPEGPSIWELVLHVAGWEKVAIRRIRGAVATLTDEENFGHIERIGEQEWRQAVETLRQNHTELVKAVSSLSDSQLNDRVPGKSYNLHYMLIGVVQHAAYHGGQIALLKRSRS